MTKRVILLILTAVTLTAMPLYAVPNQNGYRQEVPHAPADIITDDGFSAALSTALNCAGAAVACSYSQSGITLPSTTISMDTSSGLPQRIAFFLADPSNYLTAMEASTETNPNFLSTLRNLLTKEHSDPLLTASYITLKSKSYKPKDYIISGGLRFIYPQDLTGERLIQDLLEMNPSEAPVAVILDLDIFGNRLDRPISISGLFSIAISQNRSVEIDPVGDYMVNGKVYSGGSFPVFREKPEAAGQP